MINAYLNLEKASLILRIKKPNPKLTFANNLDLAKNNTMFLDLKSFTQEFIWDFIFTNKY